MDTKVRLLVVGMGIGILGWAGYQWSVGAVYTHTGWTKFSKIAWIDRHERPIRFWMTLMSQIIAGLIVVILGITTSFTS
ncbi:MAG: hypothetical protein ACYTHM_14610 [Planctomycetota bacterium]|jgi:hypothetical protein